MDLHSGSLFWLTTLEEPEGYPSLQEDVECDVVVIGGGEAGAATAYALTVQGVRVILVDKGRVAAGSTSANTGLLQFGNDKHLTACMNTMGREKGSRFYKLCLQALNDLEQTSSQLDINPNFVRRDSLYYASTPEDVSKLRQEYDALKAFGFPVTFWEAEDMRQAGFAFTKPAAIHATGDAEINPYRYAQSLIRTAARKGMRVFEHTEIKRHEAEEGKEGITFYTSSGCRIRARKAVLATGYSTQSFQKNKNAVLTSTYAITTNSLPADFPGWTGRCLIWETARPYLYIRTSVDNRIIAGGLDEAMNITEERDRKLQHKQELLLQRVQELFPDYPLQVEYGWSATFGSTHDGLPLIGEQEGYPNCYFALVYGGNGTVYATIAAKIITELVTKGSSADTELFRFDREFAASGV